MAGYHTKQREWILNFLIKNPEKHLAADDLVEHFRQQGTAIGKATVYRHLDRLVEEDLVRKYVIGDGASACYQYCGDDENRHLHHHLKCTGCGKLFHVECTYLNEIMKHVEQQHHFVVDFSKTVLYGLCDTCKNKGETT